MQNNAQQKQRTEIRKVSVDSQGKTQLTNLRTPIVAKKLPSMTNVAANLKPRETSQQPAQPVKVSGQQKDIAPGGRRIIISRSNQRSNTMNVGKGKSLMLILQIQKPQESSTTIPQKKQNVDRDGTTNKNIPKPGQQSVSRPNQQNLQSSQIGQSKQFKISKNEKIDDGERENDAVRMAKKQGEFQSTAAPKKTIVISQPSKSKEDKQLDEELIKLGILPSEVNAIDQSSLERLKEDVEMMENEEIDYMKSSEQTRGKAIDMAKAIMDIRQKINEKKKTITSNKQMFMDFEQRTKVKLAEADRIKREVDQKKTNYQALCKQTSLARLQNPQSREGSKMRLSLREQKHSRGVFVFTTKISLYRWKISRRCYLSFQ